MKGLTQKQENILDFLEEFQQRNGMPPTLMELAKEFGINHATASTHLRALERKGYLSRTSKARGLTLRRRASKSNHLSLTMSVPVLGRISAGLPLLCEENREETLEIDPNLLPYGVGTAQVFALEVTGDSMQDLGILDGDLLLAKEQQTARPGDIVIALVEDETTVKSFYIDGGKVELRPANERYESKFFRADEVSIQGRVIALHRKF